MVHDLHNDLCKSLVLNIDGVVATTPKKVVVATPVITITDTTATIACATVGVTIYYTLDGSTPTSSSTTYTGAITLTQSCTIKAIAVKSGMTDSEVASEDYVAIQYLTAWRLVGNSEVKTLPYPDIPQGYIRCKYLEFHGTEYFDTGIIAKQGISVDINFTSPKSGDINGTGLFGCRSGAYTRDSFYVVRSITQDTFYVSYGGVVYQAGDTGNITAPNDNTTKINIKFDSSVYTGTVGNSTVSLNVSTTILKGSRSIHIGRINNSLGNYVGKIFDVKFALNDNVVFNGIPCLDNNDVPCLYDTVSQTTLYNLGTGTFGYEIEVAPTEIWSCGELGNDDKYHIYISNGVSIYDIELDEPLRKYSTAADSIEYANNVATLTREVEEIDGELDVLDTPTTETITVPEIEVSSTDTYTQVISQGSKAVAWTSFTPNPE